MNEKNAKKFEAVKAKIFFVICILLEQAGNFVINYTDGFTIPLPTILCLVLYAACFYFYSKALVVLNLGVAYAVWSGVSIIFLAFVSILVLHQPLSREDIIGIVIILIGVIGLNIWGTADSGQQE